MIAVGNNFQTRPDGGGFCLDFRCHQKLVSPKLKTLVPRPVYLRAMQHRLMFPGVALVFAGLTVYLAYVVERVDFLPLIVAYGVFFGLYWWVVFGTKWMEPGQMFWLGVALRVLLLWSIPNLSDDYARFLWDGHLSVAGIHPFAHTPEYFLENRIFPTGITPELFGLLNSPEYHTVYPPVCQAVFAAAAYVFPNSLIGGVFVLKLFLLACEVFTMRLLFNISPHSALVGAYALNPLLVLEIVGNGHFEGAMICFLLVGMLALQRGRLVRGAVWWALATASKMLPLIFLPIVWRWLGWQKGWVFHLAFGVAVLVLFSPLLSVLPNMMESLNLYFRQFQFNASVYYMVRALGFAQIGWDIGKFSGPILAALTLLGVLLIALLTRRDEAGRMMSLATPMTFALFLYLTFSAIVHPWYTTLVVALSLLTKWRFGVVWSAVAMLSYSHYWGGQFKEHYGLIVLEYAVLWGFLLWECWRFFIRRAPPVIP